METKDIIKIIKSSLNDGDNFDENSNILYFRFKESKTFKINDIDIITDIVMIFENTGDVTLNCASVIVNANRIKDFYIL